MVVFIYIHKKKIVNFLTVWIDDNTLFVVMRLRRANDDHCHYGRSEQFRFCRQKESLGANFLHLHKELGLQWYSSFGIKCIFCELP